MKFLLEDEAIVVGGTNHSHATQDLTDSIASGEFPEWTLYIQTMEIADEDKFDFDPLDDTKIWPEDIFPLQVFFPSLFTSSGFCYLLLKLTISACWKNGSEQEH